MRQLLKRETSVDCEMKAFAYVEENRNAKEEKHIKNRMERKAKNEVSEMFVERPLVVEKKQCEILALARKFRKLYRR